MLNQCTLIGRMTKDPESSYTQSGIALAKFTIAVDRYTKDPTTGKNEVDFIPVVTWRKAAEFTTEYLGRGRLICVTGRVQIRSWIAQDGQKRYMTEVIAEHVQGLDRPKENASADPRVASEADIPSIEEAAGMGDPFEDE